LASEEKIISETPTLLVPDTQSIQCEEDASKSLMTLDECEEALKHEWNECGEDGFQSNSYVKNLVATLVFVHGSKDTVTLGKKSHLTICLNATSENSDSCNMFKITKYRKHQESRCNKCTFIYHQNRKKQIRLLLSQEKRTSPQSHINHRYLSKEELCMKLYNVKKSFHACKEEYTKIKEYLKEADRENTTMDTSTSIKNVMTTMYSEIAQDSKGLEYHIYSELEKRFDSDATDAHTLKNEIKRYAQFLTEQVTNFNLTLQKNANKIRYSPHIIQLALSLWANAGTRAYEEFRQSSCVNFPSIRTLQCKKTRLSVREGFDLKLYSSFYDDNKEMLDRNGFTPGKVMFDEIKMESGIAFNCKDGSVEGFVCEDEGNFSLNSTLSCLLKKAEMSEEASTEIRNDDNTSRIATHVHLFRVQLCNGVTRNVEFHYNDGCLTADKIIRQLLHVITMLYAIKVDVCGINMDAGGCNHRLALLLTKSTRLPLKAWLESESVKFQHPCANHQIAVFFCNVHNFKNLRNLLLNSTAKSTSGTNNKKRSFVNESGVKFGWDSVCSQWQREKTRERIGSTRATKLTEKAVPPSNHTKMAFSPAKQLFSMSTINEMIINISKRLGAYRSMNESCPDNKAVLCSDHDGISNRVICLYKKRILVGS
jgi:hypothetical protein